MTIRRRRRIDPWWAVRRLHQSVVTWPRGRADGLWSIIWSLTAWVAVLSGLVICVLWNAWAIGLLGGSQATTIANYDVAPLKVAILGMPSTTALLATYRLRFLRSGEGWRLLVPDPNIASGDRAVVGTLVYLAIVLIGQIRL